jgi:hypothetical protein
MIPTRWGCKCSVFFICPNFFLKKIAEALFKPNQPIQPTLPTLQIKINFEKNTMQA